MLAQLLRSPLRIASAAVGAWVLAGAPLAGFTLEDLLADGKMTPKRFANHFADFDFEFHPEVQRPEEFIARQKGDCDDYAILGDYILKRRNYDTMLIRVVLVGNNADAHDVCYVTQVKAYLDYNLRDCFINLQRSGKRLRQIADKVADSFDSNWTSAAIYTYNYNEDIKHMKLVVVKTDPPDQDLDARPSP
jgi:hypothetical protein